MQLNILIKVLFLTLTGFVISSCHRNSQADHDEIVEIPFIVNCNELEHTPGKGIDSVIGTIVCDEISLSYDFGIHSKSNPKSMIEYFSNSFYAYHYSKFFDAIFLDDKLREAFKDSVQISSVEKVIRDDKYIVECNDCDATAYLIFNGITFLYPFVMNENVIRNHTLYDINISEKGDFYKKTYLSKNDLSSGLYIGPLGNPRLNRNKKRLSITTEHNPTKKLLAILESIQLK